MSAVTFASLLCSRLCHDLVSPVGAMANGLEILVDEGDVEVREQVIALLEQSVRRTSNRLQFFRLAFGVAGGFGAHVDPAEGKRALSAFLSDSQIALEWKVGDAALEKTLLKLTLILALVASETLVRGGELRVFVHAAESPPEVEVTARGDRLVFPDQLRDALTGCLDEGRIEPRTAPAHLASTVARQMPAHIAIAHPSPTELRFRLEAL